MNETTSRGAIDAPQTKDPRRWRILWMLGVAQLMLILDVTVVAIALPHMGDDLGLSREALTWVVSGYTLAFGGLLLLGGRLADVHGSRRIVQVGLTLFGASSLAAGLATSGPLLLGGRVGQGLAAALLSPAALSLVVTTFEGEERNRALGIWSALGGGGAALGVLVGGLLTAGPGWPWVFFVNVPIAVVLLVGLRVSLPTATRQRSRGAVDVLGAVLVTSATAVLIVGLIRAGETGWLTTTTALSVAVAAALYAGFVWRQRMATVPLMDLHLLIRRPVATGAVLIAVATALMITVFFLGSFYLQQHQGFGALTTGLLFLPVAVATMAGANLTGRLLGTAGARTMGVVGLVVAALGMLVPSMVEGVPALVVGISVAAAGTGAVFVVASATALGQVAPEEAGVAAGIVSTFHEFGASIGAAVMSSIAAASLLGGELDGFARGFGAAAAVALGAAALTAVLARPRPA
ncbi:MFS transporter [Oryzobacter terrae]|uniref:MFS transporter n=1 Tax=Oryzobacter terrae TaxID=1620385 RepID=UPI00366CBE72